MKYSVIVSTYNRGAQLHNFLEMLPVAALREHKVELILVNNASTDNTSSLIEAYISRIPKGVNLQVLWEPNKGKVFALNHALHIAKGEFIIFTDDDCYFSDNYFDQLSLEVEKSGYWVDYFGGKIDLYDKSDDTYCSSLHISKDTVYLLANSFIPAGHVQGANMVFRKEVIEKIGLFDPNLGPHTSFRFEDIDFAARASIGGFNGKYISNVCVYHHHGRKSFSDELLNLIKKNDFSRGAYYMKLLLMGNLKFVPHWLQNWVRIRTQKELGARFREFAGFFHFLFFKLSHQISMV